MQALFCSVCKAPLHVVYSKETLKKWKTCGKCGELVYAIAYEDGRSAVRSLREILDDSNGEVAVALAFLFKYGQRRIEDIIFVAGKRVEADVQRLCDLGVLEKQGYAYKIKPDFEDYLKKYVEEHTPENRDVVEEFLE